jgi:dynactin 1
MGSMLFDFNSHEKVIDLMTDLLQKDQLDENRKNLELAEKMCIQLQTIYKNHLSDEKYDEIQFLEDLVNLGTFGCESITVYLQNINSLVQVKDDQTEIMQLLRELHLNNEELKVYLKKTLKRIPKQDNKSKIILNLPNDLQKQLEQSINQFYMVSKTLKELNYLAINSQTIYGGGSSSSSNTNEQSISSTSENNSLSAKKLEDLAYQACDKVYLVDDNGPYDNLRNSIQELNQTFMQIITGLDTGEYEKVLTDEEYKLRKYMINSPLVLAAEQFKQALIETESIRYKLETKEDEIKEIKRNLKVKLDELSEYKLRVNLNENKSETALREAEENRKKLVQSIDELKASFIKKEEEHIKTIDAMQQELDSHENEIRELKKKVPKKIANETSPAPQSPFSPQQQQQQQQSNFKTNNIMTSFNDSPYLIQEVNIIL